MKRTTALLAGLFVAALLPALASADHKPGHPKGPGTPGGPGNFTIAANPNPIVFGRTTTIAGRLSGPDNAGKTVTLRGDGYPFGAFQNVATAVTNAQGDYSFAQTPALNTRYHARQGSQETGVVTVLVRIRTSLRVSDRTPRRGQVVRFSGRACPKHNGALVRLQRLTRRGWVTVRSTRLRDARGCSAYSRRMRVYRDARYRTVVLRDADHANGISARRLVDVH
jgi:hypothetical protein